MSTQTQNVCMNIKQKLYCNWSATVTGHILVETLCYNVKCGQCKAATVNPLLVNPTTTTTTVLRPFFRDHPSEPVPEENFWTLWCKED